jgi:hypothetical protein
METEIQIRAFRATEDSETCLKFILDHQKVLENHGIYKVTSSSVDWMYSPAVFVIVVESLDRKKLFGGARIHAYNQKDILPIEEATSQMDKRIHSVVRKYAENGTGELCGLWNSIEVAGLGIGSLFSLRAGIVISEQIGLNSLFFLCSPLTLRFNKWVGSRVLNEVGNNGTFYYPKLDLLATAVILEDAITLGHGHPREKEKMLFMRKHLTMITQEKSPFKNYYVNVHYALKLADANPDEFVLKFKTVNV